MTALTLLCQAVDSVLQVGQDKWVELTNDVALQTAVNLLFGQSFACPSCNVLPGAGITSHANHGNSPQPGPFGRLGFAAFESMR